MPLQYADRVKETTTTTGTGPYTLAGAVVGFQSFAAVGDGNTCEYAVTDGTEWETGLGTYSAPGSPSEPTLARTTIYSSSNGNNAVNWGAGSKEIFLTLPASRVSLLGTVTSITVTGANGIGVSGSPITSSGTIGLSLGAITPTSVNTTNGAISGGVLTGTADASINGVTVGLGSGSITTNGAFGVNALVNNTTGVRNFAIGPSTLSNNTIGSDNCGVGYAVLQANISGAKNVGVGTNALLFNTADGNVAVGYSSLRLNTSGEYNVAIGHEALDANTTSSNSVAIGRSALKASSGIQNVGVGTNALISNTSGRDNTALGTSALYFNQGDRNVAVGLSAGQAAGINTCNNGVYIGHQTGLNLATGADYNVFVGSNSGDGVTTGARNVLLGVSTIAASKAQVTTGSNNISIGNDVAVASATASNQLCIGNLIYGTNLNGTGATVSGGQISIGYSASLTLGNANRLQVAGTTAATNSFGISAWSADALGSRIELGKSRGAAIGTNTIVQNNDVVASVTGYGANGSTFTNLASISMEVDGTPGATTDMPGRIVFSTVPDGSGTLTEAMRLSQDQSALFANTIKTAAPTTGTAAPWKLGTLVTGQVGLTMLTTQYLEVDVNGSLVKLATI